MECVDNATAIPMIRVNYLQYLLTHVCKSSPHISPCPCHSPFSLSHITSRPWYPFPSLLVPQSRTLVEAFLVKLGLLLRGTATAAPEKFGETLTDEQQRGGAFEGGARSQGR